MTRPRLSAFALSLLACVSLPADAQQSFDPVVIADQTTPESPSERADSPPPKSTPANDSFAAKAQAWAENAQILDRLDGTVDGWYPRFAGVRRRSGVAGGAGYRHHVFGDQMRFDLSAAITTKKYRVVDGHLRWLQSPTARAEVWTDYRYENFPQEDFYGIGLDSSKGSWTKYTYSSNDVMLRGQIRPLDGLEIGAGIGYLWPKISASHIAGFPSTEQVFTDATAPGLTHQPTFRHATINTSFDTRDRRGNTQRGGVYRVSFGVWDDRSLNRYDFRRFDARAVQYFALTTDGKHVVAPRAHLSVVASSSDHEVPFYVLPYVGGNDTVRSFHEFRFRDRNALSFAAEYLWTPIGHVSFAAFVDAGKVAPEFGGLKPTDLKAGYGIGVRAHTSKQTLAVLDFATGGGEGVRFIVRLGQAF
jgi:outer membrane protein assembly factor BamA